MKKLRVTVENQVYDVQVELLDEAESIRPPPPAAGMSSAAVAAPVAALLVLPGAGVDEGAPLIRLL